MQKMFSAEFQFTSFARKKKKCQADNTTEQVCGYKFLGIYNSTGYVEQLSGRLFKCLTKTDALKQTQLDSAIK